MKHKNICANCGKKVAKRELIDGKCPYCGFEMYGEFKKIRNKILEERGHKCEFCGEDGGKYPLTIHHLDFNPANNNPKNLIVLCSRCHLKFQNRFKIISNQKRLSEYDNRF